MRIFYSCRLLFSFCFFSNVLLAFNPIKSAHDLTLSCPTVTVLSCRDQDSLQLVSLYNSTLGAGWITKWDLTKPISTWYGVTLTADGCSVAILDLDNNNLIGKLPKFALPNLVHLSLGRNLLTDTIPNLNTPNLKFLDVSQNQLSGNVPEFSVFKPDTLSIENNNFIFGDIIGKSWLKAKVIIYAPQAKIPIGIRNDSLFVSTGVADKDQQFNWFKDNVYLGTFTNSAFKPTVSGMYYCLITHNTLTIQNNIDKNLVLQSQDYTVRVSNGNRIIPFGLSTCLEKDFNQLESLYDSTGGKNWTNKTNWFTADMSKWFGVNLTADGCDVAQLNLPNNNLVGLIKNVSFGVQLAALNFNNNKLVGSIPNFTNNQQLKTINLSFNKFSGSLPSFDNLSRLVNLNVSNNQLSGVLSDLSSLINLETCNLDSNALSGSIKNLTQLGSLKDLRVIQNAFSGDVPEFVSQDLTILALDRNKFIFADFFGKDWWKKSNPIAPSFSASYNLSYAPQANIPISIDSATASLQVSTGSPDADQVFNWYRNGALFATTPTSKYKPTAPGIFYCAVSHKTLTVATDPTDSKRNLVLKSDTFTVKSSNGGRALPITLQPCLISSFNELEKLYDATAGDNWTNNKNWFTADLNTWYGVSTDVACNVSTCGCSVDSINLSGNNLVGTIPNFSLSKLRILNLSNNKLTGQIPNLALCPLLSTFNLSKNKLTGSIPNFNTHLQLTTLNLADNQLSGSISNFNLPKLQELYLNKNNLSGTIPDFTFCPLIFAIDLSANGLSGSIPDFNLPALKTLSVKTNKLNGAVPNLAVAANLASLQLENNSFIFGDLVGKGWLSNNQQQTSITLSYAPQAKIPIALSADGILSVSTGAPDTDQTFKWFKDGILVATTQSSKLKAQSSGLYNCQITHNSLTVANNSLRNLILQSADTSIRISNGGRLFPKGLRACLEDDFNQLEALYDSTGGKNWSSNTNWLIDPNLANWFGIMLTKDSCDVGSIELINNSLVGAIPNLNLPNLKSLYLDFNTLSGSIPNLSLCTSLSELSLSRNKLMGSISNFAQTQNLASLTIINFSDNFLSGTMPNLNLPNLTKLLLSTNNLSGNLSSLTLPSLTTLQLNNNKLTGNIPDFNFPVLEKIDLSSNQFSTVSSPFLSQSVKLTTVLLNNNLITSSIPNFAQPNLADLELTSNKFTGSIPNFNLPNLQILSLFDNQLTGSIPNFNLPQLTDLFLGINQLSGIIPNFAQCSQLVFISLKNNKLTGSIPDFNLPNLSSLSLRVNQLSGAVPNFANLPLLDVLYLNDNKFIFGDLVGKNWLINRPTYLTYAPQAKIPITLGTDGMLSVSTGAPDSDQKFNWFYLAANSTTPLLVATTQSRKFKPTTTGTYYCQATHNTLTNPADSTQNLVLQSENYNVGVSNGERILPTGLKSCLVDAFNQLEAIYDSTGGKTWTSSANWFTNADISQWFGVILTSDGCAVSELHLNNNNLVGKLPNLNLLQLVNLDFGHNKLSGSIPNANLPNVKTLLLDDNSFNGTIPNFANCPLLLTIDLSFNLLSNQIPDFNLLNLKSLYLDDNNLSGAIPNLAQAPNIAALKLENNQFIFGDMVSKQWLNASSVSYNPQATIPLVLGTDGFLSVSTGAIDADQQFNWYNNGARVVSNRSSRYKPIQSGTWNCQVTHNTITIPSNPVRNLILQSASIALRVSKGGRLIPNSLPICLEDDFNQLEALYDSTGGNNWTNKTNWLSNGDMKTWFGIILTTDACDVAEIKLANNNLAGTLANINLPYLINLDLGNNKLTGTVPNLNLTALKNLNLNTNQFSGSVPNFVTSNMVTLDLGSNRLTGGIPSVMNYPRLLNLYLNNNQLTGTIPNLNIPTLTSLQLSNNQLSGAIPNFVFPNLTNLQLNNNQLSGTIPNFVFPNLTNLYLYQNKLSGAIPNFNSPKLLNLLLNNNKLSGAIPTFAQSTQLSSLSIDNNAFIFSDMLSKPWLNISNLRYAFQAKIPIAFNNGLFSVTTGALDADQTFNWFKDGVLVATTQSSKFKPLSSGTYSCQITHKTLTVPTDYFKNFVLQSTDSAVRISNGGRIIPNTLPDCAVAAYNQLEALYDSTGGKNWTNNTNWLTSGDMSTWYGVSLTSDTCDVSILSLGTNNLVGTLPNLLLNKLVVLDVSANNLTGAIPNFELTSVIVLNIGNNKLSGAIPNLNCPALKGLLASNNQLSGSLPNFNTPNLKILDVSFNKLTGTIPNFNLRFLSDLIFQSNQFTGSIPNFNLRLLKTIDVRDNLLSGDIPAFTSLPSLAVLYVQNNAFIFGDIVGKPWLNTTTTAYNPQANIPLILDAATASLKVFTGAADADQIFKWFVDGVLVATTSSSTYKPTSTGNFSCQISHNALTIPTDNSKNLILKTGGVPIRVSTGGRIFPTGLAACLEDDFNQLEALYDSTGGTNWTKKTNWFTSADLKTWFGITLTTDGCDVAKIFLGSNNLIGRLPNLNLPLLVSLDVSSNQLFGNIPDLALSRELLALSLNDNKLSGAIPNFNLPKLNSLDVSLNSLSGSVPNFTGAANIASLQLQNNQFIFGDLLSKPWLGIANLSYAPQASIPLTLNSNGTISVFTGASDADQIFRWYNNGVLVATTASRKYVPLQTGLYTCQAIHKTLTVTTVAAKNLVLQSTSIALRISNGGRIFPTGLSTCLEDDYNQLEALYDSTGGRTWTIKTNWLTNADLKTWYGVNLTTDGCDVSALNLSQNNLVGTIPNIKLPNLVALDLSYNKLIGPIPDFVASQNLASITLNNNSLINAIPNFSLPNLQILDVSFNQISGSIPDLAKSQNFVSLRLNNNNLTGSIPNFNLAKLNVIDVSFNQLAGNVPDFATSSQLSTLSLQSNGFIFGDLVGKRWLSTNQQLPTINLSYAPQAKIPITLGTDGILSVNTGAPDGDQIFKWFKNSVEIPNTNSSRLKPQSAGTYNCQATHNILTIASDVKKNLVLQSQDAIIRFSPGGRLLPIGLLPCLEDDFRELETLFDSTGGKTWTNSTNWFTSGDMSKWYGISLTPDSCDVAQINLSNNNLKGAAINSTIPNLNLPNLKVLDLSKNNLVGQIPNFNLPNLITLQLSGNQLANSIPIFTLCTLLTVVDLSNNQLNGKIPSFNFPKLQQINLSNNQLSDVLPTFNSPDIKNINFSGNQLSGTIPNFNLPNLVYLQLNDNKFTTGIPIFSNSPQLQTINLSNNKLTNGIPSFNLPTLQTLMLNNNQLSSNIPNFNLPSLTSLNVSANQLSGNVPAFNFCKNLSVLNIANNGFIFGDLIGKQWLCTDVACNVSASYAPQAKIGITFAKDTLSVSTGEPDSAQQFNWFKDGVLVATTQSRKYVPLVGGIYNCQISHNTLTVVTDINRNLVLQTENFEVSIFAVNFFSFTGKKGDTYNLLDWKTSLEVISDSFVVERSKDSINFAPIGALKGAGNSSNMLAYQFKDNTPLIGNNYYRIKANDNTGKFIYSNIIVISFFTPTIDLQNDEVLAVYPNPAKDYLAVKYQVSGINLTNINYQITNVAGQVIQFGILSNGDHLNLAYFAPGIYFLRAGGKVVRFVKS